MKRRVAIFLTLVLTMSMLAGCGNKTEEPAAPAEENVEEAAPAEEGKEAGDPAKEDYSDITVAWVAPLVADEFYASYAKKGLEDCAAEYGFQAYWTGADDHTSESMIEVMETCIADGVDAIGTVPLSESAWRPILEKCGEEGIPVGAAACEVSEDLIVGFVGTDNYNTGWKMIEEAHKKVGTDDLSIGILMSNLDTANQVIQKDAIEAYCKEKGINGGIVDVRASGGDAYTAFEAANNMFQAFPEMNVAISLDGVAGPQMAAAASEQGMDVCIIGMDDNDLTKDAIRNGTQYASMAQNCYKWGYYSTKMAFLAAVGRLDEMESTNIDSGVVMLTKDNLDTYAEELYVMP